MYGNPPDAVEWDGIEPDDTGLFDDVDGEDGRRPGPQAWLDAVGIRRMVCRRADASARAAVPPGQPGLPASHSHGRVRGQPRRLRVVVVRSRRPAARQTSGDRLDHPDDGVARADDAPSGHRRARRRGADCSVFRHLVSRVLGAGVRLQPAAADAGARRAARLQRHQLDGRRDAGVRPGPLDAASALVGVLGPRAAT